MTVLRRLGRQKLHRLTLNPVCAGTGAEGFKRSSVTLDGAAWSLRLNVQGRCAAGTARLCALAVLLKRVTINAYAAAPCAQRFRYVLTPAVDGRSVALRAAGGWLLLCVCGPLAMALGKGRLS